MITTWRSIDIRVSVYFRNCNFVIVRMEMSQWGLVFNPRGWKFPSMQTYVKKTYIYYIEKPSKKYRSESSLNTVKFRRLFYVKTRTRCSYVRCHFPCRGQNLKNMLNRIGYVSLRIWMSDGDSHAIGQTTEGYEQTIPRLDSSIQLSGLFKNGSLFKILVSWDSTLNLFPGCYSKCEILSKRMILLLPL